MAPRTLAELLDESVQKRPREDLFRYRERDRGVWVPVSSAAFLARVRRVQAGLAKLGVKKGDRVALLSENRLEWAVCDFAVLCGGGILVPLYATLIAEEIGSILADCAPGVVICSTAQQLEKIREVRGQVPSIRSVVVFDAPPGEGEISFSEVEAAGGEPPGVAVEPDDVATIIYTSGTTGPPKGVMLTHENLVTNVTSAMEAISITASDSTVSVLPLSHVFERMAGHFSILHVGGQINYTESLDTLGRDLLEVRPTMLLVVPRVLEKFFERAHELAEEKGDFGLRLFHWSADVCRRYARARLEKRPVGLRLRCGRALSDFLLLRKLRRRTGGRIRFFISGGAPLDSDIELLFFGAGLPILEGYGLTETSPVIALNRLEEPRLGSVGKPIPGVEVRIAEDGEILTKSACVMKGYYKMAEKTAEAVTDGWFHTGDVGRIDEDGYLFITDRKKDLIVTAGGKKVAPQPIEAQLKRSPLVAEAALVGNRRKYVAALLIPDFPRLERLAARRGLRAADRTALLEDAQVRALYQGEIDRVNSNLSRYEQIKTFALLDRPLSQANGEVTPTLKLKRHAIEERWKETIDALYPEAPSPHEE